MTDIKTTQTTTIKQLGSIGRVYASTLNRRILKTQIILKKLSRDDFKIKIGTVNPDGILYKYNGFDAEYEPAVLLYNIPNFGTADCYLNSYDNVLEALLRSKTTTTSDEMSKFINLSKELFNLTDFRSEGIFATGLQSKIVISNRSIEIRMILEVAETKACYTYIYEDEKITESIIKI